MRSGGFSHCVFAGVLAILAGPMLLLCTLVILIDDGWPVLFQQVRVGKDGRPFLLFKFRTMRNRSNGMPLTAKDDCRITRSGRVLRKYKLDELPQLWNIFRGEMNFIGPRPEVPHYVNISDPAWREVLSVTPGLVDLASLAFRNEEVLLGRAGDIDLYYRTNLLPQKLALSAHYLHRRSRIWDIRLAFVTMLYLCAPRHFDPIRIQQMFDYEGY